MSDVLSFEIHSDVQKDDRQNLQQLDKPISDLIILELRAQDTNATKLINAIGRPKIRDDPKFHDLFVQLEDQNTQRNRFIDQIRSLSEDTLVRELTHQFDTYYYNPYQFAHSHSSELDRQQTAQSFYWRSVRRDLKHHNTNHNFYRSQIIGRLPLPHEDGEGFHHKCIHRSLHLATVEKYCEILLEVQEETSVQLQRNEEILREFQEHIRNHMQYFRNVSNKLKARTHSQAEEYKNIKAKLEDKTRVLVQQYCDIILKLQAHSRAHRDLILSHEVKACHQIQYHNDRLFELSLWNHDQLLTYRDILTKLQVTSKQSNSFDIAEALELST